MIAGPAVELVVLEQYSGVAKPGAGDEEKVEDGALVLGVMPGGLSIVVDQVEVLDGTGGHEVGR